MVKNMVKHICKKNDSLKCKYMNSKNIISLVGPINVFLTKHRKTMYALCNF